MPFTRRSLCANFLDSIVLPSEGSDLPLPSTLNPSLISSNPTPGPTPTNTQFEWLSQTSLIFLSISESVSDSLSLKDSDRVLMATSFLTAGTPSLAPSNAPLPPGIPARIIPGAGGVNPDVDDLDGFTLIAILFDWGSNWDTVVHNPDSPGQIFSWFPALISTALSITGTRSSRFRHWPHSFPTIQRSQWPHPTYRHEYLVRGGTSGSHTPLPRISSTRCHPSGSCRNSGAPLQVPRSSDTSGANNGIDQLLINFDERLDTVSKGIEAVKDALEPLLKTPVPSGFDVEGEVAAMIRKHAALTAEYGATKSESETLRDELKEEKWLIVFRTVTE